MSDLHVACAAEGERYVAHSAAMLHSVLANAPGRVHVHYLHSPRFRWHAEIASVVHAIDFHEIADERVAALPDQPLFTRAMWFRIFLPELLPEADRVLYLDADTIAVDDLAPLWATDLGDAWLGAVTNVLQPNHLHRPGELGLEPGAYFNSGVLLMNLDAMRRDDRTAALHDYAVRHADALAWPDQDALNVVLGDRRVALHPRWNCMNSVMEWDSAIEVFGADRVAEARRRPGIRHFEGPSVNKPWHRGCRRELRELYFEHRRATPWPEVRLEGPRWRPRGRLFRS